MIYIIKKISKYYKKFFLFLSLILISISCILYWNINHLQAQTIDSRFPDLQIHNLPYSFEEWQNNNEEENNYFEDIEISPLGYLVWSDFPIKVYIDYPLNPDENVASDRRFLQWVDIVKTGIKDWENYLPLLIVENKEDADIIIERSQSRRRPYINPQTGRVVIPRASTAKTKYEFYITSDNPPLLKHRMKINISPGQNPEALLSASRHEFGHALGIWGHSELETDIMYYSQVRDYPEISARDLNTLKMIYQQPTRLGWELNLEN